MKAKKIVAIMASVLASLCLIAVIVSAFIPKDYGFKVAEPQSVTIYVNGTKNGTNYAKGDKVYNEIMGRYNNGFKVSHMVAFFQGKAFSNVVTLDNTKNISSETSGNNGIYIELHYGEDQNVDLHGANLQLASNEKTFRSLVIEVKDSARLTHINAYLLGADTRVSFISYSSYACHADLYNYLSKLA